MKSLKSTIRTSLGPLFSPTSFLYQSYHLCRGVLAACVNQFPTRQMIVIGITGTNGKTTTANLLAEILAAAGHRVGLSTTINFWIGDTKIINHTKMTTDNPFALQRRLRAMRQAGCRYAVIETASHALAQHRTWGIDYDMAIFTNLTWDHLDYHKTFEAYRAAKLKLFRQTFYSKAKPGVPKLAIINLEDTANADFARAFPGTKLYYTINKQDSSHSKESLAWASVANTSLASTDITLHTPVGDITTHLHLPGLFNVRNALAAATAAVALGVSPEHIAAGIESVHSLPGRMEQISGGQSFTVIVDYAHTPDGFTQSLSTLKAATAGKLITVFGAAGDRDKEKRPTLGQIASQYSDLIILTEEDPGSEDPLAIIENIRSGLSDKFIDNTNLFINPTRQAAIRQAISLARPGDTVVALAMGAQTVMATKAGYIAYNEREFIRSVLTEHNYTSS